MVLLVALGLNLKATHIVGGELYYEYLGNNNYSVTLDYFIDCVNGNPGAIKNPILMDQISLFLMALRINVFLLLTVPLQQGCQNV